MRTLPLAILTLLLAGCGPDRVIEQEHQARIEAVRREAQVERQRRESWQQATYGIAGLAIICLIVGVALGSMPRNRNSDRTP